MSKTVEADDRGRIVIPHEIREKHGDRYRVVELDDRVELIPINRDPIEGLRDAVGDAFDDKSIAEINWNEALSPLPQGVVRESKLSRDHENLRFSDDNAGSEATE